MSLVSEYVQATLLLSMEDVFKVVLTDVKYREDNLEVKEMVSLEDREEVKEMVSLEDREEVKEMVSLEDREEVNLEVSPVISLVNK